MSQLARHPSILVGLNHSVINCQWSSRLLSASVDSSVFERKYLQKIQIFNVFLSFTSLKVWKWLESFFSRWLNLVRPIENIAGQEIFPSFSRLFFRAKVSQNWFSFSFVEKVLYNLTSFWMIGTGKVKSDRRKLSEKHRGASIDFLGGVKFSCRRFS